MGMTESGLWEYLFSWFHSQRQDNTRPASFKTKNVKFESTLLVKINLKRYKSKYFRKDRCKWTYLDL